MQHPPQVYWDWYKKKKGCCMREYSHLSIEERKKIYQLHQKGIGVCAIAVEIGRDKSVISRELRRNCDEIGYLPDTAHTKYKNRRTHRKNKIECSAELKNYVMGKIRLHWSPEQISGRMRLEGMVFYVSTETIYQFIYSDKGKAYSLYSFLQYRQAKRGQIYGRKHRSDVIKNRVSIYDRPQDISDRTSIGHFEVDLTFFHGDRSENLTIMVDRMSRLTMLVKNASKQSDYVIGGIMKKITNETVLSATFDNGSEFARHTRLNAELGIKTYFCDPGSPWQKGSVESTIVKLHRYIPKTSNLKEWSDLDIERIERRLNATPRKTLGFRTPFEVFYRQNQSVALHS